MAKRELTRAAFFATLYAAATPGEQLRIQLAPREGRTGARNYDTEPLDPIFNQADLDNHNLNTFFGVIPRTPEGIGRATTVWLDRDADNTPLEGLLEALYPAPTAVVRSGHGWHVYWALSVNVEPAIATAMGRLAALTYVGDKAVYDTARNMRVPFSWNAKKDKTEEYCELRELKERYYTVADLQDELVAAAMVPFWEQGQRDELAMTLGSLFARADYDAARVAKIMTAIAKRTGDEDVSARISTASRALTRKAEDKPNSSEFLFKALGTELYGALIKVMGIDRDNGNLVIGRQHIGNIESIERDVSRYLGTRGEWLEMEGNELFYWNGYFWEMRDAKALRGYIIQTLDEAKSVNNGIEKPLNYTNKLVRDIGGLMEDTRVFAGAPNPPKNLLPLANGVLDLVTMKLYDHAADNYNRWVLDFDYEPEAQCPRWHEFIKYAAQSEDVVRYLQDWMGYTLTSGNPWQLMLWLYGGTGTGKSTFINVLQSLLGPAHVALDPHKLNEYETAMLSGKLLATCSEVDLQALRTDRLKAIISGDTINARHPYGRPFGMAFDGKLVWSSNGLPAPTESDGFFRRVGIVPFTHKPEHPDSFLLDKLLLELPGIFNWAVEGWRRQEDYRAEGEWPTPTEVTLETRRYEEESDVMARFVSDNLELDPEAIEPANALYSQYKTWCQQQGFRPLAHAQKFHHELTRLGLESLGPRHYGLSGQMVRLWKGARLRANRVIAPLTSEAEAERLVREAVTLN